MDALEEDFEEFGVKFVTSLTDAGSPYSTEQWQTQFGSTDAPLVVDENNSSIGMFSLFHDSWNAFPTFVLIDHTMTVRAKPWTLSSNSNTNTCDGSDNTIDGFSGGNTSDFIQQLVDECGALCEPCSGTVDSDGDGLADECDDCFNMSGDINEDATIDILDIVAAVNIILNGGINSPDYTECQLSNANYNGDSLINVLDIISIINAILDTSTFASIHADDILPSYVSLSSSQDDLNINISSSGDISGVEVTLYTDSQYSITSNANRADIHTHYGDLSNGTQKILIFSIDNIPFDNNELTINIKGGSGLSSNDFDIVVASRSGHESDNHIVTDKVKIVKSIYPNPFNPSTMINYNVAASGDLNITVYNILGQKVEQLYNGHQSDGDHSLFWNASSMSSGVYYVNIVLNGQVENYKVVLVK